MCVQLLEVCNSPTENKAVNQKQPAAADLLCYPAVHILGHLTGHEVH